jgi:hypothetical protein
LPHLLLTVHKPLLLFDVSHVLHAYGTLDTTIK